MVLTTPIGVRDGQVIAVPGMVTTVSLVLRDDLSFDQWEAVGRDLGKVDSARLWWIGDWLRYGERAYGETYAQGMDATGLEYDSLKAAVWVADRFEMVRRRTNLTWSHHREVASLEAVEADKWLNLSEGNKWSRNQLRATLRDWKSRANGLLKASANGHVGQEPILFVGRAESMTFLDSGTVDLTITSPPYNLGHDEWPQGGDGRTPREQGIGYTDALEEPQYQRWQIDVLHELFRVTKSGGSLFYNHKVRQREGTLIHPLEWLRHSCQSECWTLRQEIIWDRGSTHNHSASLFWPHDERIYWLTKGDPDLVAPPGDATVWQIPGPTHDMWHPGPFPDAIPERILKAVGKPNMVVLDPFGGQMTTCRTAQRLGFASIGVDCDAEYVRRAAEENGWTNVQEH